MNQRTMKAEETEQLLTKQQRFFKTHVTRDLTVRKKNLQKLRLAILKYKDELNHAFFLDMHKSEFETWSSETGFVLREIREHLRHLKNWSSKKRVGNPLLLFRARSFLQPGPYGCVLILAPWNYPFQLLFTPLVGAMAAGNCIILRPSSKVPHVTTVMEKIITENFPDEYIAFVNGSRETAQVLLQQNFDYIFFTGSVQVGKKVAEAAAKHLTPVTLELGGKNPCIVAEDAPVEITARRILFGKLLNAGQTCIAPDYLLVHESVKEELLKALKARITRFYGEKPSESPDFTHIVDEANVLRLRELIKGQKIVAGGDNDPAQKYFAPTILDEVKPEDPIMQEEVFGPVLPVLTYNFPEEPVAFINNRPTPLVLYLFTGNRKWQKKILKETCSGSVAINDTVLQYMNPALPFGGKGESGMGKYHGKANFKTFTHYRSVMKKMNKKDFPIRYPRFTGWKLKIIKILLR